MRPASFFETERFRELNDQLTALTNAPFGRRINEAQIATVKQTIDDERWAFENPGRSGRFRLVIMGMPCPEYGFPRFETRAEAEAYVARECGRYGPVGVIEMPSRASLEQLVIDTLHQPEAVRVAAEINRQQEAA